MIFDYFRSPDTSLPPLILFDYDGVIADSLEVYFTEFTKTCRELGIERINSKEAFLGLFDGNLVRQLIKAGFPLRKLRALAEKYAPRLEEITSRISVFPGVTETLARLSGCYPVFIITSNSSAMVRRFTEREGLDRIRGVIGAEEETSKVKKIRMARKRFPGYCPYYIGDTLGDIFEARRAGAVPIGAAWGWHDIARLQRGNPQYIMKSHEELLALFDTEKQGPTVTGLNPENTVP